MKLLTPPAIDVTMDTHEIPPLQLQPVKIPAGAGTPIISVLQSPRIVILAREHAIAVTRSPHRVTPISSSIGL